LMYGLLGFYNPYKTELNNLITMVGHQPESQKNRELRRAI